MTEYWVSQGNKWCDQCKIFIANNPLSIRTHEQGQRHKDNVTKRLATIRKENAAKEKEKEQAIKALAQIEAKAKQSYQKDLAAIRETKITPAEDQYNISKSTLGLDRKTRNSSSYSLAAEHRPGSASESKAAEWEYDESSGYYFNADTKYYYDPNSGLYYSDIIGKWVTQEVAFKSSQVSTTDTGSKNLHLSNEDGLGTKQAASSNISAPQTATSKVNINSTQNSFATKSESCPPPGPVLLASKVPRSSSKGAPSSLQVAKRKREEKTGHVSSEEAAAIAAREAAKKRMEEREKPLLGLYKAY